MTTVNIPAPQTPLARLRWTLIDSWVLTRRYLTHWVNQPGQIVFGVLFSIMFVLLFGYVFGSNMSVPGGGNYREFLLPGLFVMTMAFGVGETMVGINTDATRGVTDRFRSMPMAPSAVVVGRSAADMLYSMLTLTAMMVSGLLVGWRSQNGLGSALLAIGLLLLLRFAFLWLGIYLGLVVKTPEAAGSVWALLFPITMLTNAMSSPELMPTWLRVITEWNPLSSTVSATRILFGNPGVVEGGAWVTQHSLLMAVVWPLVVIAIFLPLSVRRYRRLSR